MSFKKQKLLNAILEMLPFWAGELVVEQLLTACEALGPIPSTAPSPQNILPSFPTGLTWPGLLLLSCPFPFTLGWVGLSTLNVPGNALAVTFVTVLLSLLDILPSGLGNF